MNVTIYYCSFVNIKHQKYILNSQSLYLVSWQALIELLDQVEDVISVESSTSKDAQSHLDVERYSKADVVVHRPTTHSEENRSTTYSNFSFLVLEVGTNTFFVTHSPSWNTRLSKQSSVFFSSAIGFRKARTFWIIWWSSIRFQGMHALLLTWAFLCY